MEVYIGSTWMEVSVSSPNLEWWYSCMCYDWLWNPADVNTIDYFNMATGGNAIDFGDLNATISRCKQEDVHQDTRGINAAGTPDVDTNEIFIEICNHRRCTGFW